MAMAGFTTGRVFRGWVALMESKKEPHEADDLPAPSAELVLIRVFVESYLATAHRKPRERARSFMTVAAGILADEESVSLVFPIRPAPDQGAATRARRQALVMFRQLLPTLLARIPHE